MPFHPFFLQLALPHFDAARVSLCVARVLSLWCSCGLARVLGWVTPAACVVALCCFGPGFFEVPYFNLLLLVLCSFVVCLLGLWCFAPLCFFCVAPVSSRVISVVLLCFRLFASFSCILSLRPYVLFQGLPCVVVCCLCVALVLPRDTPVALALGCLCLRCLFCLAQLWLPYCVDLVWLCVVLLVCCALCLFMR